MSQFTLYELIEALKKEPKGAIAKMGFRNPHSYRGYYDELAFEPDPHCMVKDLIQIAKSAREKTYHGWKGGVFTMHDMTPIWLATEGDTGEMIGPVMYAFMMGRMPGESIRKKL